MLHSIRLISATAAALALLLITHVAGAAQPHRSRHVVIGPATGPAVASVARWQMAIKNQLVPGYPVEAALNEEFALSRDLQGTLLRDMKAVFGAEWPAIMSRSGSCPILACAGAREIPSETHNGEKTKTTATPSVWIMFSDTSCAARAEFAHRSTA